MNQWKAPGSVASSFTRQLQEVGMYRDTTLTAASRAKIVTKLRVAKEKERAKRAAEQVEKRRRRERVKLANTLKLKLRQLDRQQRRVNLMSKVTSARLIQRTWKRYTAWKASCVLKLLYDSAVVIQKLVRRHQCRVMLFRLRRDRRINAARELQACFRGFSSRKQVAALVRDRFAAAVLLQSHVRRHRACKLRAALHLSACICCIQRVWRGFLSRRRVELLVIKELEFVCQQAEEKRMSEEDFQSSLIEEEMKRMQMEREQRERAELELKLAQEEIAQKHGIPLLPWRRRTTSFSKLVQQQRRERVRKEKEEERQCAQQAEQERLAMQQKLIELEKHRSAMLQKSKRRSRELRAYKRKTEMELKKLEELESKKRAALQKLKRKEEERTNAKRRARLLSLSKRKQERERQEAEERRKSETEREQRRLQQLQAMEHRRMEEIRKAAEETKKRHALEERKKAEEQKLRQIANQEAEERRRVDENLRKLRLRERVERQKEKERQRAAKVEKELIKEQEKRREEGRKKAVELRRRILENLAKEERAKDRRFPGFAETRQRLKRQKKKMPKRKPAPVKARRNPGVQTPTKSPRVLNNIDESIENIFRRAEDILLPRLSQTTAQPQTPAQGDDESSSAASTRGRRKGRKKKQKVDDTLARALEWKLQELRLHGSPNQNDAHLTEASLIEIANPILSARRTPELANPALLDQLPSSEEYSDDSDFERGT